MKFIIVIIALLQLPIQVRSQDTVTTKIDSLVISESIVLDLQFLVAEVIMNNPEIEASLYQMKVMDAKVPQASSLDEPELKFMTEGMPGLDFNKAMFHRLELMQMFRFPTKLSTREKLAKLQAEHSHHDHQEKVIDVLEKLKIAYYELWFVQQNIVLTQENIRLMNQFAQIALTKYGVGLVPQQDVLKAQVEIAVMSNELISLRQQELSTKAMLMAILNRQPNDTLGYAIIPEDIEFTASLDSLELLAMQLRPMLTHDSLAIQESQTELSIAKQEYLPDFKIGIERLTSPIDGFGGWSVTAGITLPFAPWALGKASARKDEASSAILRSTAAYNASKNMVRASVKDLYYKVMAGRRQLETYRTMIIPQAEQSLSASRTAYQTGTTNFLMLIDAYRTVVMLTKDYFMTRMQFEQSIASLERAVGYQSLMATR